MSSRLYIFSKVRSRRNLVVWLRETIDRYALMKSTNAINIGAGGEISKVLASAGVNARSIDITPERNPDVVCNIEDMSSFAAQSVDVVFCFEVFEHVTRPHVAAREILRILKPGGMLVGSTPFLLGIHDQPRDYFRYTYHGLRLLFREFDEVTIRERNGYFASVAVLLTRPFVVGTRRERRAAMLASPLLIAIVLLLEWLDRIIPSINATTGYFFVFRRPDK